MIRIGSRTKFALQASRKVLLETTLSRSVWNGLTNPGLHLLL